MDKDRDRTRKEAWRFLAVSIIPVAIGSAVLLSTYSIVKRAEHNYHDVSQIYSELRYFGVLTVLLAALLGLAALLLWKRTYEEARPSILVAASLVAPLSIFGWAFFGWFLTLPIFTEPWAGNGYLPGAQATMSIEQSVAAELALLYLFWSCISFGVNLPQTPPRAPSQGPPTHTQPLSDVDRVLIRDFLQRRDSLEPSQRKLLAMLRAAEIHGRVGGESPSAPEAYLEQLATLYGL